MKQRIICKGLAVAVILLFLGLAIQPSVATVQPKIDMDVEPEQDIVSEPSGLLWGTYWNCHISEESAGFNLIYPFIRFRYILTDFALILIVTGLRSCILSGAKGDIAVGGIIGFGFTGSIRLTPDPREPDTIEGDLLFCIYH